LKGRRRERVRTGRVSVRDFAYATIGRGTAATKEGKRTSE